MLPEAIEVMTEELAELGNPSSLHNAGRRARRVVEESREQIAEVLNARPSEVVFTSGGTEADNLAVKGLYWARRDAGRRVRVSSIEHHAVLARGRRRRVPGRGRRGHPHPGRADRRHRGRPGRGGPG